MTFDTPAKTCYTINMKTITRTTTIASIKYLVENDPRIMSWVRTYYDTTPTVEEVIERLINERDQDTIKILVVRISVELENISSDDPKYLSFSRC